MMLICFKYKNKINKRIQDSRLKGRAKGQFKKKGGRGRQGFKADE